MAEPDPRQSDGYPEAWFLPAAVDIPAGFAWTGTYDERYRAYERCRASSPLGRDWGPGRAVFQYPNDQRATTLWYHNHALGVTRLNVYAGPAGRAEGGGARHARRAGESGAGETR